jgi:hypothetical protein
VIEGSFIKESILNPSLFRVIAEAMQSDEDEIQLKK